jgi:hypothetical protein
MPSFFLYIQVLMMTWYWRFSFEYHSMTLCSLNFICFLCSWTLKFMKRKHFRCLLFEKLGNNLILNSNRSNLNTISVAKCFSISEALFRKLKIIEIMLIIEPISHYRCYNYEKKAYCQHTSKSYFVLNCANK